MSELRVGPVHWEEEVHLWAALLACGRPAEMSKSPEGRVSKVGAGIVSVGREDGDVLVQILEVEGGWRKTNPETFF